MLSAADPGVLTLIVMESQNNTSLTVNCVSDTRVHGSNVVVSLTMRTSYEEQFDGVHVNVTLPKTNLVDICKIWPLKKIIQHCYLQAEYLCLNSKYTFCMNLYHNVNVSIPFHFLIYSFFIDCVFVNLDEVIDQKHSCHSLIYIINYRI